MLEQFCAGLKTLDVLYEIRVNPEKFKPLFVNSEQHLDPSALKSILKLPKNADEKCQRVVNMLCHCIDEFTDEGKLCLQFVSQIDMFPWQQETSAKLGFAMIFGKKITVSTFIIIFYCYFLLDLIKKQAFSLLLHTITLLHLYKKITTYHFHVMGMYPMLSCPLH